MMCYHRDQDVKLSVVETCPHPSATQGQTDENGDQANQDSMNPSQVVRKKRCLETLVCDLQRRLRPTCRALNCCYRIESEEHDAEDDLLMPVEESTPSQVSTQPWGRNEEAVKTLCLQPSHNFFRTVPVFPWTDTQVD